MNTIENQIKDFLIRNGLVSIWEDEEIESDDFVDNSENDADDIGVTISGVEYSKRIVLDFMKKNGYQLTPENIDMVAKKFAADGKITVNKKKKVIRTEIDEAPLSLLQELLPLKQLELIYAIYESVNPKFRYRYAMVEIPDLANGTSDFDRIMKEINEASENGWRVKHIFNSKSRVQSQGVTAGGFQSTIQSLNGATTILFEGKEYQ